MSMNVTAIHVEMEPLVLMESTNTRVNVFLVILAFTVRQTSMNALQTLVLMEVFALI